VSDVSYYLKIMEIPGESVDQNHEDEIEIFSWGWGIDAPEPRGGSGGAAGKAAFQDISFHKQLDKASPNLAKACVSGEHFREAVISARRGAGPKYSLDFLVITLSDVTISAFHQDVESVGSSPSDSFSIRFGKIDYAYTLQKADGTSDSPTRWTWDLKTKASR
jgi:type VI secretion system secreted protein Hcp